MTVLEIIGNWMQRLRILVGVLSGSKVEQPTTKVRRRKTRVFFEMP